MAGSNTSLDPSEKRERLALAHNLAVVLSDTYAEAFREYEEAWDVFEESTADEEYEDFRVAWGCPRRPEESEEAYLERIQSDVSFRPILLSPADFLRWRFGLHAFPADLPEPISMAEIKEGGGKVELETIALTPRRVFDSLSVQPSGRLPYCVELPARWFGDRSIEGRLENDARYSTREVSGEYFFAVEFVLDPEVLSVELLDHLESNDEPRTRGFDAPWNVSVMDFPLACFCPNEAPRLVFGEATRILRFSRGTRQDHFATIKSLTQLTEKLRNLKAEVGADLHSVSPDHPFRGILDTRVKLVSPHSGVTKRESIDLLPDKIVQFHLMKDDGPNWSGQRIHRVLDEADLSRTTRPDKRNYSLTEDFEAGRDAWRDIIVSSFSEAIIQR